MGENGGSGSEPAAVTRFGSKKNLGQGNELVRVGSFKASSFKAGAQQRVDIARKEKLKMLDLEAKRKEREAGNAAAGLSSLALPAGRPPKTASTTKLSRKSSSRGSRRSFRDEDENEDDDDEDEDDESGSEYSERPHLLLTCCPPLHDMRHNDARPPGSCARR